MTLAEKITLAIILLIIIGLVFSYYQNNVLQVSKHKYKNAKIPKAFDGYRIVQISDLHNKSFGKRQSRLINKIKDLKPDIIIITGDIIDRRRYKISGLCNALTFVQEAKKIAPLYFSMGNHEAWSSHKQEVLDMLKLQKVTFLNSDEVVLQRYSHKISLLGISSIAYFQPNYKHDTCYDVFEDELKTLESRQTTNFSILMSHHPEFFEIYTKYKFDVIFSGHAHGGQMRLPFIGGIFSPTQGLFPKYTEGCEVKDTTTMYISRGLGNSLFPVRIFNRPEIICVTLEV